MLLRRAKKAIVVIEGQSTKKIKKFNFFTIFEIETCNFKTILDSFLQEISDLKPKLISLNKTTGSFLLEVEEKPIKGNITISEKEHYAKA